jgi:hypothetical protein
MSPLTTLRKQPPICGLVALWLCVPVGIVAAGAFPVADSERALGIPLVLTFFASPLVAIIALAWAVRLAFLRLWLPAVAALMLAPFLWLQFVFPTPRFVPNVWGALEDANASLHFLTKKSAYDSTIRDLPDGQRHLHTIVWESDPEGGSGVVYDEDDQLAQPRRARSKDWLAHVDNPVLFELCKTNRIDAHYYLISFGCDTDPK